MKTQRDKFEEWAKDGSKGYVLKLWTVPTADGGFAYTASLTSDLWQAWCAAIESVVVELPKEAPDDPHADQLESGLNAGYNEAIRDFKHSIDKAGFKYE